MADTKWNAAKRRVFQSVFHTSFSQPTPTSTPSLGSWEPGQSFGGPLASTPQKKHADLPSSQEPRLPFSPENPHATDQTRFDRSWHAVTSRIALPPSVAAEDSFGPLPSPQDADDDGLFMSALQDILDPAGRLPLATHTEDILSWHTQQVRLHFVNHVVPLLSICDSHADQTQVLLGSMRTLEAAHRQYAYGMSLVLRGMERGDADTALSKFRRDLHAIVGNSVSNPLMTALKSVLGRLMATVLGVYGAPKAQPRGAHDSPEVEEARREVLQLVESLHKIGLAGERFQILFAEILNELMITYLYKSFAGVWEKSTDPYAVHPRPRCVEQLVAWIEERYARLAVEVANQLGNVQVSWTDVEKWKEIAIGRLAALRITELFDIVMNWPDSEGVALQKRLLHPGRSTLDILRTYISMIRTFQKLDHSRVLLDRVAYSLQLYLCTREDTVRIIVTSLLSSPKETLSEARKVKLVELAELLHDPNQSRSERQDDEWDDLSWRQKSEDVIGTLIGALGSPEVFIKEFQNIIGERLLSDQVGFEQEVVVLDLLKKRFGESLLQACDVMIKDIQDSKRLDGVIHRGAVNHPDKVKHDWTIHTKILSRLYWPDMGEEPFVVPEEIVDMQKMYETIFQHLKPTRTLKWLNHLGQAKMELELEDRTISEEVQTYEAAVISAFSEHAVSGRSPSWTFEDLWMHLQMDEDLLAAALRFWERKQVLRKLPNDEYVVMERLESAEQQLASENKASSSRGAKGANAAAPTPRKAKKPSGMSEKEKEKRQVYWRFIVGMLTNSSPAMPLGQIAMMMKMLIADGFPWSNEELQEFLGDKIADGELELAGGKYKLIKK
ncbi:anaphase-promoting complex subunit ApcB [Apiospora aurea]|uniref:Anaphase-promoting complex subunit 2 n=1 Tax=Apiospora aurea TaxID=335848 RepID=A0ABR1QC35_9PEZI